MLRPTAHDRATPSSRPPDPASSLLGWPRGPRGRHRFHLRPGTQPHARPPSGSSWLGSARPPPPHDGRRPRRPHWSPARGTVPPAFRAMVDRRRGRFGPGRTARRGSGGEARTALAAAAGQDRAAGSGPHADAEPMGLRAMAVVRLVGAFPLGHLVLSMRRPARGRPVREYTGRHRRRTKGLTTESASRPRPLRALWKSPVLYSGAPSPRQDPVPDRRDARSPSSEGYPPLWKGSVDTNGDSVL